MVEVNLISEENTPREFTFSRFIATNIPFVGAILLLSLAGGVSVALLLYRSSLKEQIGAVEKNINEARALIDESILSQITAFDSQIVNFKKALDTHRDGSRLLAFLETHTLKRVSYKDMNVDIEKSELRLNGLAASYGILAKQLVHFESLPEISKLEVSEIKLSSEGGVTFSLSARISQEVFSYR